MPDLKDKLIVALDVAPEKAEYLVDLLLPQVKLFKVGASLFPAHGLEVIKMIGAKGAQVFLDLKFLDIPKTVYSAVASGTSSSVKVCSVPTGLDEVKAEDQVKEFIRYPVFMMTLHTLGGLEMLKKAKEGATDKANELKRKKPYLVGVTVLTSEAADKDTSKRVLERAHLVKDAGLDGVVCAVSEAAIIRKEFGKDFIIVTPGIRPKDYPKDDQKRTATPHDAITAGADFIVVGRPIIEAEDPRAAAQEILQSLN